MAETATFRDVAAPPRETGFFARLRSRAQRQAESTGAAADLPPAPRTAPLSLIELRQSLYGRGNLIAGDEAWVLALAAPLRLDAAAAALDLAAGLGGAARILAAACHCRVTGLERDFPVAQQGNALAAAAGAAPRVEIAVCDPEFLELEAARFDAALGREATFALAGKERFLRVVAQALRPYGRIALEDFVLDRTAGERDELTAWQAQAALRPRLWTAAQYADCFKSLGVALQRFEDVSALYRRQIVAAWIGYLRAGGIRGLAPADVALVLAEAEACRRTVAALESGALKYYRFAAARASG